MTVESRKICEMPDCDDGCRGWAWFNGCELQRCDTCERFADDAAAVTHILTCTTCKEILGTAVASECAAHFDMEAA